MNKKGFTLIELIAVVVIMAIIALIATPNIVNMMDKGKKEDYVADAKEIISKATYMYKLEKYKNKFDSDKIYLKNINGIDDNFKDPYGFSYDKEKSYVDFSSSGSSELKEREVKITLISKKSDDVNAECYTIETTDKNSLDANAVKQGTWSGTGCNTSIS